MKKITMLSRISALVCAISLISATLAPRRADAVVGIVVSAPAAVAVGAVIGGLAIAGTGAIWVYGTALNNGGNGAGIFGVVSTIIAAPFFLVGLVILPADLSGQYRFPMLQTAPQGISESEFSDYVRDRALLEVLAQDVRAAVTRDIVSENQWKAMSLSERMDWAESLRQDANKLWAEYVSEGLISEGALKTLSALAYQ